MKEERLAIGGAVIAAIAASLCCIGPLLFVVLGLGAFGAAAAFQTARPYLLGAAVLLLAFGFYRTYFRRASACAPGEACETKRINRASRIGLWIASIAVLAFALSPYYGGYIAAAFVRRQVPVQTAPAPAAESATSQTDIETVTVKVEGMDCTACEAPIRAVLEKTPGVRSGDVSYKRGDARVEFDPKRTNIDQIKRAIDSTGYKAK
ncbi:MAG: cation transporter [Acidobacteria bacterium]|nr:cation transporter [Acidobacteriota bacterium]